MIPQASVLASLSVSEETFAHGTRVKAYTHTTVAAPRGRRGCGQEGTYHPLRCTRRRL